MERFINEKEFQEMIGFSSPPQILSWEALCLSPCWPSIGHVWRDFGRGPLEAAFVFHVDMEVLHLAVQVLLVDRDVAVLDSMKVGGQVIAGFLLLQNNSGLHDVPVANGWETRRR